jgi:hypothetical protein
MWEDAEKWRQGDGEKGRWGERIIPANLEQCAVTALYLFRRNMILGWIKSLLSMTISAFVLGWTLSR